MSSEASQNHSGHPGSQPQGPPGGQICCVGVHLGTEAVQGVGNCPLTFLHRGVQGDSGSGLTSTLKGGVCVQWGLRQGR